MKRRTSFLRKIFHNLLRFLLAGFAISLLATTAMRFTPPLTSGLMIERRLASLASGESYQRHYQWVPLEQIAPLMGVAVVAAEDQLFAEHFGFDWKAIEKAVAWNQSHRKTRGASTISQQTAKNLFLWDGRSWLRKGMEVYFTLLIETLWSKERILEVYLNIVEFGDGIYGVEAASRYYFHKPAKNLRASEAALLAAVLPNPHIYQVGKPSEYVRSRQQWILRNMNLLGGTQYLDTLRE
ncbi:MAG TPA: monofunctional biosynthetic peptidoglycan transglycosylase [Pseudomonadales bacterium]|nr:monofunctional biosynthetic peptidoglycan transglycosylase [Pseudomonadales bacterium]